MNQRQELTTLKKRRVTIFRAVGLNLQGGYSPDEFSLRRLFETNRDLCTCYNPCCIITRQRQSRAPNHAEILPLSNKIQRKSIGYIIAVLYHIRKRNHHNSQNGRQKHRLFRLTSVSYKKKKQFSGHGNLFKRPRSMNRAFVFLVRVERVVQNITLTSGNVYMCWWF